MTATAIADDCSVDNAQAHPHFPSQTESVGASVFIQYPLLRFIKLKTFAKPVLKVQVQSCFVVSGSTAYSHSLAIGRTEVTTLKPFLPPTNYSVGVSEVVCCTLFHKNNNVF